MLFIHFDVYSIEDALRKCLEAERRLSTHSKHHLSGSASSFFHFAPHTKDQFLTNCAFDARTFDQIITDQLNLRLRMPL
jgi:hypothetical protein